MNLQSIIQGFADLYRGALKPGSLFGEQALPAVKPTATALMIFGFGMGLLLFITGLVNAEDLQIASDRLNQYVLVRGAALSVFHVPHPAMRIFFPLYWAMYLVYVAGFRHVVTIVFGEPGRSFHNMLLICVVAVMPMILFAGFQGVLNNLFPMIPPVKSLTLLWSRVAFSVLIFVIGFFWEAFIFIVGARTLLGQNYGRAFLTWVAPFAFFALAFNMILALV